MVCHFCNAEIDVSAYSSDNYISGVVAGEKRAICERCLSSVYDNNWDYKPDDWDFHKKYANENEFIGMELEIEPIYNDWPAFNIVYAKLEFRQLFKKASYHYVHDGSLRKGTEIVIHPMTYQYYKDIRNQLYNTFDAIKQTAQAWGSGRCGLHTHHSKSGLSVSAIYKLIKFYFEYELFFYRVGGKSYEYFARYARVNTRNHLKILNCIKGRDTFRDSHHMGINIENAATVEIRFFRNTLNKESFNGQIQFNVGLIDFVKEDSLSDITPLKFINFLKTNQYKDAIKVINKRFGGKSE